MEIAKMGRQRKTAQNVQYQTEENILPQEPDIQADDIDYGYPMNIIEEAAITAENKLEELYGWQVNLSEEKKAFYKTEAIDAVKFYILHPGATTRQFQSRWLAGKLKAHWQLGPFDLAGQYHPNLLPFEELSDSQREVLAIFKAESMGVLEKYRNQSAIGE